MMVELGQTMNQVMKQTWKSIYHLPLFYPMRRAIRLKRLELRPGRKLRKCYQRRIARRLKHERKRYRA